jgi:hypothetical protein
MSRTIEKKAVSTSEIRSMGAFRKRYFPKSDDERASTREPEAVGAKLAKESLDRFREVLSSLNRKQA